MVTWQLKLCIGYGGHYGPAFVTFFDQQNAKIDAGQIDAEKVVVSALMINKSITLLFLLPEYFFTVVSLQWLVRPPASV